MSPIITAALIMAILGLCLSLFLGIAAKVFYVEVDPRIESILDVLPGANCGGCGYAGCSDYAEAIVMKNEEPNKCVAGGANVVEAVCSILGVSASLGERKIARIQCRGDNKNAKKNFEYIGAKDCYAAIIATGGNKACEFGCIGLGSCVEACPFGALSMGDNGIPVVNEDICTGCGCCVNACPRNIPKLFPASQKVAALCCSQETGKTVKSVCKVGCIGCGICAKKCPEKAIKMVNSLPVIDNKKCTGCLECVKKCPTGAMVSLVKETSQEEEQEDKANAA
ncbi:Fe-S cluster domain-containing protein [Desulfothermus okinawensis JCM 13304]